MLTDKNVESIKWMRVCMLAYDRAEREGNEEHMEIARQRIIDARQDGFKVSRGENAAIHAYCAEERGLGEMVVVNDFGMADDANDLLYAFERLGVKEFIVMDSSTALMEWLTNVLTHGWWIDGVETVPANRHVGGRFGADRRGLRLKKL